MVPQCNPAQSEKLTMKTLPDNGRRTTGWEACRKVFQMSGEGALRRIAGHQKERSNRTVNPFAL